MNEALNAPLSPGAQNPDDLVLLPLGGAGEIGMNLNLYGLDGKWLMVDLGITFPDEGQPGIDVILPDPTFIADRADDLLALVVTHGHEDHLGAIGHLWPRLQCPVYASKFACALIRGKLAEAGLLGEVELIEFDMVETLQLGPFELNFIPLTHSIPEMAALAIKTRHGTVVHTGDWKLDPVPLVGPASDEAALEKLGDSGVLALVCDSTNVFEPGTAGSEEDVRDSLIRLVGEQTGRVAVTSFASNVARIASVGEAAVANDRHLVLVGRSMLRIFGAAREAGYLSDMPETLNEDEAGYLPPDKVFYLCTGCQGESRGAMARIAFDQHRYITLDEGDTVIFSARTIPGNEMPIKRVQDELRHNGVRLLTDQDAYIHVSGHPCRDELTRMYQLTRPQIAVPVHGERQHLKEHARFARALQVPDVAQIENGQILTLAPGSPRIVAEVQSGRWAIDGRSVVPLGSLALKQRRRMMFNGGAVVTVVVDKQGHLAAAPSIVLKGIADADDAASEVVRNLTETATLAITNAKSKVRLDNAALSEAVRLQLSRFLRGHTGRRPSIDVSLIRLEFEQPNS